MTWSDLGGSHQATRRSGRRLPGQRGATARTRSIQALLVAALAALGALWLPTPASAAGPTPVAPDIGGALPAGWFNAKGGPVGPGDMALLEGVRRANIWEGEGAGPMGVQKGQNKRVREVGKLLADQHAMLEREIRVVAQQLNVQLPTDITADHRFWLSEMEDANGAEFDQVWVDRLRAAHGKVYSLIASVRANTRNTYVRKYAELANATVTNHMKYLESTGLVRYNDLPTPNAPSDKQGSSAVFPWQREVSSQVAGVSPTVVWLVLLVALGAGGATVLRMRRAR